jgi:hypothetical protein
MRPSVEPHLDNSGLASESEVQEAVTQGWRLQRDALVRDLEFRDFDEAIAYAARCLTLQVGGRRSSARTERRTAESGRGEARPPAVDRCRGL